MMKSHMKGDNIQYMYFKIVGKALTFTGIVSLSLRLEYRTIYVSD